MAKASQEIIAIRLALRMFSLGFRLLPKVAGAATSFAFLYVLSHWLDAPGYGNAALLVTLAAFGAQLTSLGQRFIVLREIPPLLRSRQFREASTVSRQATTIAMGGATAFSLLGLLAITSGVWPSLSGMAWPGLVAAAGLIFLQGFLEFQSQLVRALGHGDLSVVLREVIPRAAAIVLIGFASVASYNRGLTFTLVALAVGTLLSVAFSLPVLRRRLGSNESGLSVLPPYPKIVEGFRYLARSVFATLREYMSVLIIGIVADPSTTAVYFTLVRFTNLLTLPATAFATTATIKISTAVSEGDLKSARRETYLLFRESIIFVLPCAVVLLLASPYLLNSFGLSSSGSLLLIVVVVLNGFVQGSFCSLWELIQVTNSSNEFNKVFSWVIAIGGIMMFIAGHLFGVVALSTVYLLMNCTWILYGLIDLRASMSSQAKPSI